MSELLEAAAAALATPSELVRRSAAARAEATGSSIDDVLGAWAGGAPIATAAPAPTPETAAAAATESAPAPPAAVAVAEQPIIEFAPQAEQPVYEPEPEEPLDPAPIRDRIRTAVRVGAWTGAALGVVAFLIASSFWASSTALDPDSGPVVAVSTQGVLIGAVLISIVFGAIVAGFSRSGAAWSNPAMQLSSSSSSTAWLGGALGLVFGAVAGVFLNGLGTEIEGSEGLTQIPILSTLFLMVIGGAVLGALTAAIPQVLGTPVAVAEEDKDEVVAVRARLGNAIGIPLAGLMLLLLLVLPFAYTLIQSNHMTSGGASIVAVLTAGGILGFASLSGSRPEMKISLGELMVAVAGIGTVLLIIVAVLFYTGADDSAADEDDHAAAITLVV